jgi:negative regulator of sigma F NrsF-like protein
VTTPPGLRDRIARDLEPTRPLRAPFVRVLVLVPLAAAIVVAVPALHFFRSDMGVIGFVRAWGFSVGQAIAGLVIVAAALHEAIPGRALPRAVVASIIAAGLVLPVALLALTAAPFDVGPGPGRALMDGIGCFRTSAVAAVPALVVAAFLAARAFPVRPSAAGALYGLGAGLIADAGLRLYCEYSQPAHVILAHGGAIVASLVAGVVLALVSRR